MNDSGGGISFIGALTIAFIVLKLTEVIAWSWWWVLSPIWIPAACVVAGLAFLIVVAIATFVFKLVFKE